MPGLGICCSCLATLAQRGSIECLPGETVGHVLGWLAIPDTSYWHGPTTINGDAVALNSAAALRSFLLSSARTAAQSGQQAH